MKDLEQQQGQLEICEKALADYMESKRRIFPRFYFVSTADLLDILSNGNNPVRVMQHMSKCFQVRALFLYVFLLELGMLFLYVLFYWNPACFFLYVLFYWYSACFFLYVLFYWNSACVFCTCFFYWYSASVFLYMCSCSQLVCLPR